MLAVHTGGSARVAGILLLGLALTVPATLAADPVSLTGRVRDSLGNILTDVEVLFVEPTARDATPAAVTRSDAFGRFTVLRLAPGRYRVAAIKTGYETFVGQVNTLVQDSIELVLRPAASVDPGRVPQDASWTLRLPRRGILREVQAAPLASPASLEPRVASLESRPSTDDMSLEVEQVFSAATALDQSSEGAEIRPTQTRMQLASSLGQRGQIQVQGWREQFDSPAMTASSEATATQRETAFSLDMSYDTSPGARLVINAFFNALDYELSAAGASAPDSLLQEQRAWGYDASWTKQIDAASRVAVHVDYKDTSLVHPGAESNAGFPIDPALEAGVSNRAVAAQGSYEVIAHEDHAVAVAVRAQVMDWPVQPLPEVASGPDPLSRWSVQAEAQDTWSLVTPFSLIYGLGYKQTFDLDHDATLIVPKLGGKLSTGGWFLRAQLSYHAVASHDAPARPGLVAFRPENSLGYEAELQVPLVRDVRLTGTVSYTPIQFGYAGYAGGEAGLYEQPLYLTDGNVAVREHRLALVEERGLSATYLELSDGRADGTVAPLLAFGTTLPVMRGMRVGYRTGRLGLRLPSRGADIRMEYRRVEAEAAPQFEGAGETVEESVEVRIRKDLPATQVPGDWRVLLAVRVGSVKSDVLDEWDPFGGVESIEAMNRRVSAGVSVLF